MYYLSILSITIDKFKKKATNYCIRFGHSLWSAISCQRKWLTSLAGMTYTSKIVPKLQYFLSFKYI